MVIHFSELPFIMNYFMLKNTSVLKYLTRLGVNRVKPWNSVRINLMEGLGISWKVKEGLSPSPFPLDFGLYFWDLGLGLGLDNFNVQWFL